MRDIFNINIGFEESTFRCGRLDFKAEVDRLITKRLNM